jgi:hypothetical protein
MRDLGIETYTVVRHPEFFHPDLRYDVNIKGRSRDIYHGGTPTRLGARLQKRWVYLETFLRALRTCDVFVFMSSTSFIDHYLDYALLKLLDKRIVTAFLGTDIRHWFAYTQEARLLGTDHDIEPYLDEVLKDRPHDFLEVKLSRVRAAERYADLILSLPDMGQLQTRPYMRVNLPMVLSDYRFSVPNREVPLILHAPSHRGIKGTEHVLAAIDRLRGEGVRFDFRLLEDLPNTRVLEMLTDSDIVVDAVNGETIATLALEGMATGNVVLTRYLRERNRIGRECPAVYVNVHTLANELRRVIEDRDLRCRVANAGPSYVRKYHDHVRVAQQILDWLKPGGIKEYDFVPTFYRDHFRMPSELLKREREMWRRENPSRLARLRSLIGSLCTRQPYKD